MTNYQAIFDANPSLKALIITAIIWDLTWKLIALWRAARNNQKKWFIAIGILNTLGILPIVYLLLNKKCCEGDDKSCCC
jgi:hypothetical protein